MQFKLDGNGPVQLHGLLFSELFDSKPLSNSVLATPVHQALRSLSKVALNGELSPCRQRRTAILLAVL